MLTALILAGAFAKVEITELTIGKGESSKPGDVLTMLYKGTFKSGKVFDETTPQKPPYAFKLGGNQVIDGWEQGLQGMKVGGKRKLIVPWQLAYGEKGYADIPAKTDLIFVVELLRIDNAKNQDKLIIKETKPGTGRAAKAGDSVSVHYTGKFLNGFKFDSSVGGDPLSVTLGAGQVIKGFDQGITGMKKGGKRTVTIPYTMAYKEAGRPPRIPRMATLVFDLELVDLK